MPEKQLSAKGSEKTLCAQIYRAVHNAGGCGATSEYDRGYDDGVSAALEAITLLTGVDESCLDEENDDGTEVIPGRWIPVTERMPGVFQPVIICREIKGGELKVEVGSMDHNGWWKVYGTRTKSVLCWMPLPEPPTP